LAGGVEGIDNLTPKGCWVTPLSQPPQFVDDRLQS
jgi:hypothetical protein